MTLLAVIGCSRDSGENVADTQIPSPHFQESQFDGPAQIQLSPKDLHLHCLPRFKSDVTSKKGFVRWELHKKSAPRNKIPLIQPTLDLNFASDFDFITCYYLISHKGFYEVSKATLPLVQLSWALPLVNSFQVSQITQEETKSKPSPHHSEEPIFKAEMILRGGFRECRLVDTHGSVYPRKVIPFWFQETQEIREQRGSFQLPFSITDKTQSVTCLLLFPESSIWQAKAVRINPSEHGPALISPKSQTILVVNEKLMDDQIVLKAGRISPKSIKCYFSDSPNLNECWPSQTDQDRIRLTLHSSIVKKLSKKGKRDLIHNSFIVDWREQEKTHQIEFRFEGLEGMEWSSLGPLPSIQVNPENCAIVHFNEKLPSQIFYRSKNSGKIRPVVFEFSSKNSINLESSSCKYYVNHSQFYIPIKWNPEKKQLDAVIPQSLPIGQNPKPTLELRPDLPTEHIGPSRKIQKTQYGQLNVKFFPFEKTTPAQLFLNENSDFTWAIYPRNTGEAQKTQFYSNICLSCEDHLLKNSLPKDLTPPPDSSNSTDRTHLFLSYDESKKSFFCMASGQALSEMRFDLVANGVTLSEVVTSNRWVEYKTDLDPDAIYSCGVSKTQDANQSPQVTRSYFLWGAPFSLTPTCLLGDGMNEKPAPCPDIVNRPIQNLDDLNQLELDFGQIYANHFIAYARILWTTLPNYTFSGLLITPKERSP